MNRRSPDARAARVSWLGFILLTLCLNLAAHAENSTGAGSDLVFERMADQLGGRQATVYDIIEDPSGFIWFASDTDGVLRFDGAELKSWTEGFRDNLTRSNVSTVRVTAGGRLWVGSWGNGLQYWDRELGRYVQFLPDPRDPHALADHRVQRLMVDQSGRLWVGTMAGINLIDAETPQKLSRFAHDQPDHPLHQQRIWGMLEHRSGFWLATSGGVFRLSGDLEQWQHYVLDETAATEFERGDEVRTIALAHDRIWAGSQLGLFIFNPEADRFEAVEFKGRATLPPPRINALLESRHGGLWVGAHDGLYRVDETLPALVRQGEAFNLIPDVDIRSLYEDHDGSLWIGSRDQGIIHGQRRDRLFESLSGLAGASNIESLTRLTSAVMHDVEGRLWLGVPSGILRQNVDGDWQQWRFDAHSGVRRIERLAQTPDGRVWVATDNGLYSICRDDELVSDTRLFSRLEVPMLPVSDLLTDRDGGLWLALWHYGVVYWHPDRNEVRIGLEELRDTRGDLVYQLSRGAEGELWAGTRYAGLFRHDGERWLPVPVQLNDQQYPPSLYCAVPAGNGQLWLCTQDGLVRFDPMHGVLEVYGVEDGLPANRVTGVWPDRHAGLWVLTPRGVGWRRPGEDRFVAYGMSDGLPALSMQRNAVDAAADGRIVMGSSHGAVRVIPERASRGLDAPRTVLSRVWLDGIEQTRLLDLAEPRIVLPPDHRDISLKFAVLDFREPTRNLIRYQLHDFDAQPSALSSSPRVRYMNLRPGHYQLEVQGLSSRGVPAELPLLIPIEVQAPWWHSPWAWIGALILLTALFWINTRLRLRALQQSNQRLQALIADRTRELETANAQLQHSSSHDFLTGLLNRRGLSEQFNLLQKMSARNGSPLSLILFDIDHFKRINDDFGHETGDALLKAISELLNQMLRGQDLAARWGGEEFLLALHETQRQGAIEVCERLRAGLLEMAVPGGPGNLSVTASFGLVTGVGSDRPLEHWIKHADRALYEAKRSGRNRIVAVEDDLV